MSTDRLLTGTGASAPPTKDTIEVDAGVPPDRPSAAASAPESTFTRGSTRSTSGSDAPPAVRLWTPRSPTSVSTTSAPGRHRLNIDTDIATKLGFDPDHPLFEGEVGPPPSPRWKTWNSSSTASADRVSSTLIVQPPASAPFLAMYLAVARRRGIPPPALIGTIMNCALTQLAGATQQAITHFFPIDFSVRVGLDVMEYCTREMRRWNIVNVNAYNMRETGINAIQEAAFALSLALEYAERLIARGLDADAFAQRMAFFTAAHMDLFEEVAKPRAMRRIWARLMRERLGAKDDRSCWFRTAIQTAALPLGRAAEQHRPARPSRRGGGAGRQQSIHTTSYDECTRSPGGLPSPLDPDPAGDRVEITGQERPTPGAPHLGG